MAIEALKLLQPVSTGITTATSGVASPAGPAFGEKLASLVANVEDNSAQANQAVSNMLNKTGDVHDAMIALQRAEMTLQLTVQLRNKFVQAYNEIMRMPI